MKGCLQNNDSDLPCLDFDCDRNQRSEKSSDESEWQENHNLMNPRLSLTCAETMIDPKQTIQISSELTDENLLAICEAADVIACECPSYLVRLLNDVREFRRYTNECIERFPSDAETHHWLSSRANQVEMLLSLTIYELLQKENLLDENNQLNLQQLSDRNRAIALSKILQP